MGNYPLRDNEKGLTKRISAGKIWIEDSIIGDAKAEDYHNIQKELATGLNLVEKKILELYHSRLDK